MTFRISVVIPVYNAAQYVREAVESALAQPETAEVILVEDRSPDGSLAVCEQLAQEYDNVRLLRHPNGENRGAGESRNLGIINARSEYVAFLDADDYYLPGRFTVAARILAENPDVDGVYETIGLHYMNDTAREDWKLRGTTSYERGLLGPSKAVPPENFLEATINREGTFFSGNGLVIRTEAIKRAGMYDSIPLTQDAILCFKLAAHTRLMAGRLDEPVAMYRLYGNNRSSVIEQREIEFIRRFKMMDTLWQWGITNLEPRHQARLFQELMFWQNKSLRSQGRFKRKKTILGFFLRRLMLYPSMGKRAYFMKPFLYEIFLLSPLKKWSTRLVERFRIPS